MILGLGNDLCAIERIGRAIEKRHFMERVYTPAELARLDAATDLRRPEIAAGLFAAKEAVAKALGTGFAGLGPWDIEIAADAAGRPLCRLSGGALERLEALGGKRMLISITHAGGFASAVAVLEG